MKKDKRETVEYILKHNLKVVARHYLSDTSLDEANTGYWRGYYDATKAVLSLLTVKQTKMEGF